MFTRLKNRWKVNSLNLVLIICTFALGGSACARVGKGILNLTSLEQGFLWWFIYIILITLLWPICVLLISIPLGQFVFFKNYIQRIGAKLFNKKNASDTKIAIFASGKGSNAENIIQFGKKTGLFSISVIVTNNQNAGVVDVAKRYNIQCVTISANDLEQPESLLLTLQNSSIKWIILAGFLKKIPATLISAFSGKIINIHPALLPEFGGVGMYGNRVHQAVISSGKKESGITIHWVDEHYDNGDIIFTAKCDVLPNDTPETLETRVRSLEILHYPKVIAECIKNQTVR
jgi:formyltetrahydrofolate-dependent phosphoribosylglycinamide formyltransferase